MKHIYKPIIIAIILSGCNLDQIDSHYDDYNAIVQDGYNKKGWLPENLILSSTTDLHSRTDVDVNSFMIRFSVSHDDLNLLLTQLEADGQEHITPHRLKTPKWWSNTESLPIFKYTYESNTWWFAVDSDDTTVYCWGDH